jgi:hypothetical protein
MRVPKVLRNTALAASLIAVVVPSLSGGIREGYAAVRPAVHPPTGHKTEES